MSEEITFIALVLEKDDGRIQIFRKNKKIIPELKLFRSVNGFLYVPCTTRYAQ
jgi:hypothetical protein